MAHGFVLAGIGFDLGANESHVAQARQPGQLAQRQDLNVAVGLPGVVQTLEDIKVAAPEFAVAGRLLGSVAMACSAKP